MSIKKTAARKLNYVYELACLSSSSVVVSIFTEVDVQYVYVCMGCASVHLFLCGTPPNFIMSPLITS